MLEKELEAWCKKYAGQRGCLLLKFTSPGTAGVPDRVLVTPGGVVFCEFKRPGGRMTTLQRAIAQRIERAGGKVFVINEKEAFVVLLETLSAGCDDPFV